MAKEDHRAGGGGGGACGAGAGLHPVGRGASVRRDSGICGCIWTRTAAWTFWTG